MIIGGGPSRSAQVALAPGSHEAIYISANDHGLTHWRCHYALCLDLIEARMRKHDVPIISTKRFGEVRIFVPRVHQSGMMSAYAAWVMGCSPILLAGMDLWTTGTYEDDRRAKSTGNRVPLSTHLTNWRHLRAIITGDVRSLGGPLVDHGIFPLHNPDQPAGKPEAMDHLFQEVGGLIARFTREVRAAPFTYRKGDVVEIAHNDVHHWHDSIEVLADVRLQPEARHLAPASTRRVQT